MRSPSSRVTAVIHGSAARLRRGRRDRVGNPKPCCTAEGDSTPARKTVCARYPGGCATRFCQGRQNLSMRSEAEAAASQTGKLIEIKKAISEGSPDRSARLSCSTAKGEFQWQRAQKRIES